MPGPKLVDADVGQTWRLAGVGGRKVVLKEVDLVVGALVVAPEQPEDGPRA